MHVVPSPRSWWPRERERERDVGSHQASKQDSTWEKQREERKFPPLLEKETRNFIFNQKVVTGYKKKARKSRVRHLN